MPKVQDEEKFQNTSLSMFHRKDLAEILEFLHKFGYFFTRILIEIKLTSFHVAEGKALESEP